jgi:diguanylate cyclase (GGDEF)-like protein/PAS domain S-box-containing protein
MLTHSVENRFISIILAVLILVIAPLFVLFFHLSEEKSAKDAADRNQIMIQANAQALGKPLWDFDVESIAQITKSMTANRLVLKVEVRDLDGQIHIAMPENADVTAYNVNYLKAPVEYQTVDGTKNVGMIEMYFVKRSLFDGNYHGEWAIIAIFIVAVMIVFFTAIIGNRQLIIKPLLRLTAAIEATRRLGSRHKVDWVSRDEMGVLAVNFNEMQDRLAQEENQIRLAHQRTTDIYNRTPAMLYSVDADDRLTAVSDYWLLATGYLRADVIGRPFSEFVAEPDRAIYQDRHSTPKGVTVKFQRANGEWLDMLIMETMVAETGAQSALSLSVMTNVTELKAAEHRNHVQAITDHLTGLLNRQGFENAIEHKITKADRDKSGLACLFVDLDRFKWINDTLGHAIGDKVLQHVVTRMRSQLRQDDTLARLGGDEFAILISTPTAEKTAVEISGRISRIIDTPLEIDGHMLNLSASIGIALYPDHAETAAELLQKSDLAMYARKRNGKNGARLFDPALANAARNRAQTEANIEAGLKEDWFDAFLQPIFNLKSGRIAGFEALMRLIHPEQGIIPPSGIIQNAEETGAIVRIGDRIFEKAVARLAEFSRYSALKDVYLAVNISPLQFEQGLLDKMTATLMKHGVQPRNIVIEITEAVLMNHNPIVQQILEAFAMSGYRLALDDFGTGYSSLSYLHRFPVDIVKIDQSFIRSLTEDAATGREKSRMLVEGIKTISHQMNCLVVAEGIEKPEQRDILAAMGVDAGQGYLFSRPLPGNEIIEKYASQADRPAKKQKYAS